MTASGLAGSSPRYCSVLIAAFTIMIESILAHSTFANGDVKYSATPKPSKDHFDDLSTPGHDLKLSRRLRYLLYPEGASTGIWVDLTLPLGLPMESVFVSMNFEANYGLPDNITQLPFAGIGERRLTRRRAYYIVESWLSSLGMHGRTCLLRTICETTENTLVRNGLASEIIHWLFTPSSSAREWLSEDIKEAERLGRTLSSWEGDDGRSDVNCRTAYPSCPISPFDLFTLEREEGRVNEKSNFIKS